eukprot:CAMPEP_0172536736 /NCGR_PEP_ID=MMETSP1067-20121228/8468_1 /TAXON_ID=265564 ORGANISM="Thalassiosira punctigera, Strain Tpunct2005C2" /NCGR_SAMPLE_ID=MMETSP1067 /ASSEMBLY_ACC=CAM_ASM_000444 /LENGTH=45 /DNA_ID= /DNA_START= /DNA_END= /DNA_ORIENTATION=
MRAVRPSTPECTGGALKGPPFEFEIPALPRWTRNQTRGARTRGRG